MKIAILTLPLYANYGGILQCYALQTVLERMGHEVFILSKPKYKLLYYPIWALAICKRFFKHYILGIDIDIIRAPFQIIRQNTDVFIKKYIHKYVCRNWTTKTANQFDAIIVGSDQVWRLECFSPIEDAFLDFAKKSHIRRFAYAASFGIDKCPYSIKQLKQCKNLLQMFERVSVREFSGVEICRNYFGVDAIQMLDPTLLLSVDDYRRIMKSTKTYPFKGDMMVYMLDRSKDKEDFVERIAKEKGLTPFWMSSDIDDNTLPLEKRIKMSVEQWLRGFNDAKYVLTDSFHGCVFSIMFRKNFIAIGNQERGLTRFISLLQVFGLEDRLIVQASDYNKIDIKKTINWDRVDSILKVKREGSFNFLNIV